MNCKQGDLAIVVVSACGNEGRIVQCVEFAGDVQRIFPDGTLETTACWKIDPALPGALGGMSEFSADYQLRPLRDQDGEDETIAWAGKPEAAHAA